MLAGMGLDTRGLSKEGTGQGAQEPGKSVQPENVF